MVVESFVGPSHTLRQLNTAVDRTINLIPMLTAPGTAKSPSYLTATPGFTLAQFFSTTAACRGCYALNGRGWTVIGPDLYEIDSNGLAIGASLGTIADDGLPVFFASNGTAGNQVLIVGANHGYTLNLTTNVLTAIAVAGGFPAHAIGAEFLEGYFFVLDQDTRSFSFSNLEDGSTGNWPSANVNERSIAPDSIVAMLRNHREMWFFGNRSTEVWVDQGDANIPFAPLQGVLIEMGIASRYAAQRVDNSIFWVGNNEAGGSSVWRADGYTPKRVSTDAVDQWLEDHDTTDCLTCTYRLDGHAYFIVILREAETSWAYDVTTGIWHERGAWDPTIPGWTPYRMGYHIEIGANHIIGDWRAGVLYLLDPDNPIESIYPPAGTTPYTTVTETTRRLRRFMLPFVENTLIFLRSVEFIMRVGAEPSATTPDQVAMLRLSIDGGSSWGAERTMTVGRVGEYLTRVIFRRFRPGRNPVLELTTTNLVATDFLQCVIDADGEAA